MTLLPDVTPIVQDGGLGILPPPISGSQAKIGHAATGPINTIVSLTSPKQAREVFGSGPLMEAVAFALTRSGGPVYAVRAQTSVSSTVGLVVKAGAGTGSITITGTPNDNYQVLVRITRAGNNLAALTAAFQFSLDGGDNYSVDVAVPSGGTYTILGSGLTLTFVDGGSGVSFALNDVYQAETTAPGVNLSNVVAALDVLLADPREWDHVHIVGTASAAFAAGVAVKMDEAAARYRYTYAILEARDRDAGEDAPTWQAALLTEYANFVHRRVMIAAGHTELASPFGTIMRRSVAWVASAHVSSVPVHEHLGRLLSGPETGVVSITHNEFETPALDASYFTTLRTIIGRPGFYFTRGRMKAPLGSDFQQVQFRRVMDAACRLARNAALKYLNEHFRVDRITGFIDENQARFVEGYVTGQIIAGLNNSISDVTATVDRTVNMISTSKLVISVAIVPLAYAEYIEIPIGFRNPALERVNQ
jgi:hypothetical protein